MLCNLVCCLLKSCFYLVIFIFVVLILIKIYLRLSLRLCTCKVKLTDKTVLITGGNTGIGFETAKILAKRDARVIIASRNVNKSQEAVQALIKETGNPKIEYMQLDLSKLSNVKKFADDFNSRYERLDVLINNAAFADFNNIKTEDGIEKVMQVNHVGPVYLTNLLLDKVISSKPSRIIFVSSTALFWHKFDVNDLVGDKPVNIWAKYCNTKLCNMMAAKALSKRVPEGVTVNSLHPGLTKTEIYEVGPVALKPVLYCLLDAFFKTPEECAQSSVHMASAPNMAEVSGQFIDNCEISKPPYMPTDELIEQVWEKTLALIEDRTQKL